MWLKQLAKKGNKKAKIISNIIEKPDKFLRVVLTGTNIAIVVVSAVSSSLAIYFWGERGVSISVLLTTLVVLVFSEIIPKIIGQNNADNISLNSAYSIKIASAIFLPIETILSWISNFIIRIFTGKGYIPLKVFYTKKDLKIFFEVGEKEGAIEKNERSMIHKILNLDDVYVKDVMKPKKDVIAIEERSLVEDAVNLLNSEGLSRIPVYKDNFENIIGFIHAKDFLISSLNKKLDVKVNSLGLIHKPYFVSETKRVIDLLSNFQKRRVHIAVVLDHNKKISGVVTIEDLLEEIFGEIEDEFDKSE